MLMKWPSSKWFSNDGFWINSKEGFKTLPRSARYFRKIKARIYLKVWCDQIIVVMVAVVVIVVILALVIIIMVVIVMEDQNYCSLFRYLHGIHFFSVEQPTNYILWKLVSFFIIFEKNDPLKELMAFGAVLGACWVWGGEIWNKE